MKKPVPLWIVRAADARARGVSLDKAARLSGRAKHHLASWIYLNRKTWVRVMRQARRETRDAACDEAVALFRHQLRAQETKSTMTAATALARTCPLQKPSTQRRPNEKGPFDDWLNDIDSPQARQIEMHVRASEEESIRAAQDAAQAAETVEGDLNA